MYSLPVLAAVGSTGLSACLVNVSYTMCICDNVTRHREVKGED